MARKEGVVAEKVGSCVGLRVSASFMCFASVMNRFFKVVLVASSSFSLFAIMYTAVIFASGLFSFVSGQKSIWSTVRRA